MTPYEMGKISAFLLVHRRIEERSQRRPIHKEERDFAEILRDAGVDEMRLLEEMMTGYGFELVMLTAFDVKGISPGARAYMLVRLTNAVCPLLETSKVIDAMGTGSTRNSVAKIWFTQIWLLHLDLIYSARGRGPQERNEWLESNFTKEQLLEAVRSHINGFVRKLNPEFASTSEVYSVLSAEKGSELPRYVQRFLNLMVDAGMLEEIAQHSYRQSLLAAVEMKTNYDRVLAPLMVDLGPQMPVFGQIAQPLLTTSTDNPNERKE
ncbi:hypothetical protein [Undibacterium sp. TS12]|uniref:hypothetical protein n=1 Tax=Undibacterium sp. TS12 TaxID=2908202 RepID=UPI001F4CBAD8|nr:hypothetical protein [Undibacterium sp. TS12]MCH8618144.1 hypothetical protein [Undibacterium sp. TS12]